MRILGVDLTRQPLPNGSVEHVLVLLDDDGRVTLRPIRSRLGELRGMLRRPGRKPVSIEEMDAAIAREHAKR